MTLTKHYRAWLLSAGFFLLLAMAMVGPLIFNAMADLSSAEQAAIQARNAAINEAILNRDYNAWSSLNSDKSLTKNINADNFAAFAEAYSLLQQGKVEEANAIKEQAEIQQKKEMAIVKTELINQAIQTRNYYEWRSLVGPSYSRDVNYSNFDKYAEIIKLAEMGKLNKVDYLLHSQGLKERADYSSSH